MGQYVAGLELSTRRNRLCVSYEIFCAVPDVRCQLCNGCAGSVATDCLRDLGSNCVVKRQLARDHGWRIALYGEFWTCHVKTNPHLR